MRRKKCHSCGELYDPYPQTYRQQKVCYKAKCKAWRIRQKWRSWSFRHPLYHLSRKIKQKRWREQHPQYWKTYRQEHSAYVKRNRKLQKLRDAQKRGFLAKPTAWEKDRLDKLERIRALGNLAKPTDRHLIAA
jgi:hypothetical protein